MGLEHFNVDSKLQILCAILELCSFVVDVLGLVFPEAVQARLKVRRAILQARPPQFEQFGFRDVGRHSQNPMDILPIRCLSIRL